MPSSRYAEIAPRVSDICGRYGLPYDTGPLPKQLGAVAPHDPAPGVSRRRPRRKPGPYRPEPV